MTFIVFALPRSRTAWAATFLSRERPCGHDLAVESDTLAGFAASLRTRYCGTVETGAVVAWRALRLMLPEARIAVIRRPVGEVYASLERLGFGSEALRDMLEERNAMLDELARQKGVLSVSFKGLSDFETCRALYEHCLDQPLDWEWWEGLADQNIQIDVPAAIDRLAQRRDAIERLKAEAQALAASSVVIRKAAWDEIWPDVDSLFAVHFAEVDGGVEPNRPYRVDEAAMRAMSESGVMLIFAAWVAGALVGYLTWTVVPDIESKGLLIALQGAWFVCRGYERLRIGERLFDNSIEELKRMGVQNIFPHHRTQGRGANLGAFFRRRGAKEIQHTYSLWIGG